MKDFLKEVFVAFALLLCAAAVSYAIHEIIPSETMVPLPGADAEKLNDYIVRHNPYKTWGLWPGKGRLYKGTEPHGALLTTFINETAASSIKKGTGMSESSIIVKENYSADKKFMALTVMYKIKGYNPAEGDWFWAKYAPDGTVEASGKVHGCIDCHEKMKDNDYIWTGKVRQSGK